MQRTSRRTRRDRGPAILLVLSGEGTLFDSASVVARECYLPPLVDKLGFGAPSLAFQDSLFHIALHPRHGGGGRYRILARTLDLIQIHPLVNSPDPRWSRISKAVDSWLGCTEGASLRELERSVASRGMLGRELEPVLAWSRAVEQGLRALPPFRPWAGVEAALARFAGTEVILLSGLPTTLLRSSWKEIDTSVGLAGIFRNESDSRTIFLDAWTGKAPGVDKEDLSEGRRFDSGRVLLLGTTAADLNLARSIGAVFYPLLGKREEEGLRRLGAGFAADFLEKGKTPGDGLIPDFVASFRQTPLWR